MAASTKQGNSPILITTPLGPDKLLVQTIQGEERISGLFHYSVELISTDNSLDFSQIVGKNVTISLALLGGEKTYLNAVVGRFVQAGKTPRFTTYYADLYPWLWLLTMNSDCRIFQNMSTPEIIKKVFSDLGFSDFTDKLTGTYQPREYCVQYMETSFDFVSRLMEEEGIFYFFTHDTSAHKMVLADDAGAFQDCADGGKFHMRTTEHAPADEQAVTECSFEEQVVVGQFKATDYNFEMPSTSLLSTASSDAVARSIYEYPGVYQKKNAGDDVTKRTLTALQASGKILRGSSTCRAMRAGFKFALSGHTRDSLNASYVLQRVSLRADQATVYSNSFDAFPSTITFRPPRTTPKPRVHGAQTATVVGKSGEEIWTDQYGRIIVQFHWDQKGQNDEKSSCWVRVSQGWAGKQWGAIFIPRIGQEVIVSFLEGNPDRPLVTGCVYNATQTVPYGLPGDSTRSTIKSNSSKGGGGFNEIRFEDKKDSEEIFIQAQKDLNLVVLNDETDKVKNNRTVTIQEKNETLIVDKGDRTVKVNTGKETHEVKGTREVTVTGNETHNNKANYDGKVTGNFTLKVQGNITIEATGSITMKSGMSFEGKAGMDMKLEAGMNLQGKAGMGMKLEAGLSLESKAGLSMKNEAGLTLENKAGLMLKNEAGATLMNKAAAMQMVDGGGLLSLKGGLIKIN